METDCVARTVSAFRSSPFSSKMKCWEKKMMFLGRLELLPHSSQDPPKLLFLGQQSSKEGLAG